MVQKTIKKKSVVSTKTPAKKQPQKQAIKTATQTKKSVPSERHISFFEWGVFIFGVFCIMAGLGLIIASNWDVIPAFIKIVGGLSLLGGGLYAAYVFHQNQKLMPMEIALFVSFLLIGGNLALIQQVYHLNLSFSEGSLIWGILGTPFLFLTKRLILPIAWVLLIGFGIYDYLKEFMNIIGYQGVAGLFFVLFLTSYFKSMDINRFWWVRKTSLSLMFLTLFFGDFGTWNGDFSAAGLLLTILAVGFLGQASSQNKPVRFFNIVLIYAALQVVLLFWNAYASLFKTGLSLVLFGIIIVGIGVFYFYNKEKFLKAIDKGFNQ